MSYNIISNQIITDYITLQLIILTYQYALYHIMSSCIHNKYITLFHITLQPFTSDNITIIHIVIDYVTLNNFISNYNLISYMKSYNIKLN